MASVDQDPIDTPAWARALTQLETAAGGRESLVNALVALGLPEDDKLSYVVGLLADPRHDARNIAALCRAGGVTLGELIEAFKRGVYARMLVQVTSTIADQAPKVVEDVFTRAQTHEIECPKCHGSLQQTVEKTTDGHPDGYQVIACDRCIDHTGVPRGRITVQPELDTQRLALDLANLTPKKGPSVVVDNRQSALVMQDTSPAGFTKLMQGVDRVLQSARPKALARTNGQQIITAEVLPSSIEDEEIPPPSLDPPEDSA